MSIFASHSHQHMPNRSRPLCKELPKYSGILISIFFLQVIKDMGAYEFFWMESECLLIARASVLNDHILVYDTYRVIYLFD
nr:hypothetical protein [Sphaerochaeta globosa]